MIKIPFELNERTTPLTSKTDYSISRLIIGAAIEVHRHLGPGLLESSYELCLAHELKLRGIAFETQKTIPITYKGVQLETSYRADMVVEGLVVVELKAIDALAPIHKAQMLSYLRAAGLTKGLLINFNVPVLKDGVQRIIL